MPEENDQHRLRLTFGKRDTLRFIGHLDLAKTWERVLRRAGVPLVYSQGFNPQPKMQLAAALPLGISSDCELLDIWVHGGILLEGLPERLNAVSPPGLVTYRVEQVPLKAPALQTLVRSAEYLVTVEEVEGAELRRRIADLLGADHIERERRGKTYDLRPLIIALSPEGEQTFRAHLALSQEGTARPDELLAAMGLSPNLARCHRVAIHLQEGDATVMPE